MSEKKVVILMGSAKDKSFTEPMCRFLKNFGANFERRVASAHKTPEKVLKILEEHERTPGVVYIAVAGGTDALSGFVDASTRHPVIACPPPSGELGETYFHSSLRPPSGVVPLVILDPEGAALAALKILAQGDATLLKKITKFQQRMKQKIEENNREIKRAR